MRIESLELDELILDTMNNCSVGIEFHFKSYRVVCFEQHSLLGLKKGGKFPIVRPSAVCVCCV